MSRRATSSTLRRTPASAITTMKGEPSRRSLTPEKSQGSSFYEGDEETFACIKSLDDIPSPEDAPSRRHITVPSDDRNPAPKPSEKTQPRTSSSGSRKRAHSSIVSSEDSAKASRFVRPRLGGRKPVSTVERNSASTAKRASTSEPRSASASKPARASASKSERETPEPFIIAHNDRIADLSIKHGIGIGVLVTLAIAIQVGKLRYEDIKEADMRRLTGKNSDAVPRVSQVFPDKNIGGVQSDRSVPSPQEIAVKNLWLEFDRELESSLEECLGAGGPDAQLAYAGKIRFGIRISESPKKASKGLDDSSKGEGFTCNLLPVEKGPSDRYRRRHGSDSFIRVTIDTGTRLSPELLELLKCPFIFFGMVYRLLFRKERHVFLYKTGETYRASKGGPHRLGGPDAGLELALEHNPMETNKNQSLAKWSSRHSLAASTTIPAVVLDTQNIKRIPDIISPAFEGDGKPPAEMIMTDGCGFANRHALQMIGNKLCNGVRPTAVQMRIGGAKGLLLLNPDETTIQSCEPEIWIRPSQEKIIYQEDAGEVPLERRIIEVVMCSSMSTNCRISYQVMINLAENGVPLPVFDEKITADVERTVDSLTNFEKKDAMRHLHHEILSLSGLALRRQARESAGETRAGGLADHDWATEGVDIEDDEPYQPQDEANAAQATPGWPDPISGYPSDLAEKIVELLVAGFTPQNCPMLRKLLASYIKRVLWSRFKPPKYYIHVPMSCRGFFVPDPTGVLKPGEVFCKSSQPLLTPDGQYSNVVTGPCLITRPPCMLPTDVRKFTAVDRPELALYVNVIVFSVQGERSGPSRLAGGDCDGDIGTLIWDPAFVIPFNNADDSLADEPHELANQFEQEVETVADIVDCVFDSDAQRISKIQDALLGASSQSALVGIYNRWWQFLLHTLGYDHPTTIRYAHMFNKILDGDKSGLRVKGVVINRDSRERKDDGRLPAWAESDNDRSAAEKRNLFKHPEPFTESRTLIMDHVYRVLKKQIDVAIIRVERLLLHNLNDGNDPHLVEPYKRAEERAAKLAAINNHRYHEELVVIKAHVEKVQELYSNQVNRNFLDLPAKEKLDITSNLSHQFSLRNLLDGLARTQAGVSKPILELIALGEEAEGIMASYAYFLDLSKKGGSYFPWVVAFHPLCHLKAAANRAQPVTREQYESFGVHPAYRPKSGA